MFGAARLTVCMVFGMLVVLSSPDTHAQSGTTVEAIRAELETLKQQYEDRISTLESQLEALKHESQEDEHADEPHASNHSDPPHQDNAFNPSISLVLDGRIANHSADESELAGYPAGHESGRTPSGLSLGHSELVMTGSIDDKFMGNLTLGLGVHPGEPLELELEEAYVRTLPGIGIMDGFQLTAGRALWTFGYLNELHAHVDDFADRPLPYRAYLDGAFNDDGVEMSLVLPTDMFAEFGGGVFRGDDMPFGGSDSGVEAWSAYGRIGGDAGRDGAWRVGASILNGRAHDRMGAVHVHGDDHADDGQEEDPGHDDDHDDDHLGLHDDDDDDHEEEEHEHLADFFTGGAFTGNTRLVALDVRYTWAPTGNPRESELILQGEYFWRVESGLYTLQEEHETCEDPEDPHTCHVEAEDVVLDLDGGSSGWYVQGVYKFSPQWRAGARYARLELPEDAEAEEDHSAFSAMVDWSSSEFGRVRLQYNREHLYEQEDDNQVMLQYIMSLGAHGAHSF
ncbi:MAG: hypothetical protein OXE86_02235 [Alphaproteobacteria bacterium]|nr:hypothetical protein [Alphaproteobacteria bacterium]